MFELDKLQQQAVDFAIKNNWEKAIEINKQIISLNEKNLEAWLRLGFSYFQSGNLSQAEKSYQEALKIQPANQIARENLKKIHILGKESSLKKITINKTKYNPQLFIEEPGKTKTVSLIELCQKNVLAKLAIGEEVFLKFKRRKVNVKNSQGKHIGCLPDDLSRRLSLFVSAKSFYRVFIKEITLSKVVVIIREIKKGRKVAHYISFPENMTANMKKIEQSENKDGEGITMEEDNKEDKPELELMAENLEEEDQFSFLEGELGSDEDEEDE